MRGYGRPTHAQAIYRMARLVRLVKFALLMTATFISKSKIPVAIIWRGFYAV
jgi:hypothetical protein